MNYQPFLDMNLLCLTNCYLGITQAFTNPYCSISPLFLPFHGFAYFVI